MNKPRQKIENSHYKNCNYGNFEDVIETESVIATCEEEMIEHKIADDAERAKDING